MSKEDNNKEQEVQDETQASFAGFPTDQREELREKLRSRLIECGWRDQVATMCRNIIQKNGAEQVRLDQLVSEVGPKAKQSVPDQVRTEILEAIRKEMRPKSVEKLPQQQQPLQKQVIKEVDNDSLVL